MFGTGVANLKGRVINLLEVGDIARRDPFAWHVTCLRCGTKTVESHNRLTYGASRCQNRNCGKVPIKPSTHAPAPPIYEGVRSADSASAKKQAQRETQPTAVDIEIARYEKELAERRANQDAEWAKQVDRMKKDHQRYARHCVLVKGQTINEIIGLADWFGMSDLGRERVLRLIEEENKNASK